MFRFIFEDLRGFGFCGFFFDEEEGERGVLSIFGWVIVFFDELELELVF